MSLTHARVSTMAVASALLLASLGVSAPVAAADSPEAAINEFFDIAVAGEFSRIGDVVCAAEQDAMLEAFDFSGQLGLDAGEALAGALALEISDRSIDVIDQDGDSATVAVSALMAMSVPEDQIEALARAMLEADLGSGDAPVSDDDVAMVLGFMSAALNQTMPIDQEVTVVREEGGWLVCGGLIDEPEEPDYGFEPSVSTEGPCGLVSPDEMSALSALEYSSSNGFETFCTYSTSDFEDYYSTTVSYTLDSDAQRTAASFGADQVLEVAGNAAFASGSDAYTTELFTQVGEDVLQVSVSLSEDPPEGFDWLAHATQVTELFMPRLADFRLDLLEPTPEPTPEISLCEALPLDEINDLTGLGFDDATGGSEYCDYSSLDGEPGYHIISVSLSPLDLDDYRSFMTDIEDTTVADVPAIAGMTQLIVELPGGAWTLSVLAILDPSDEAMALTTEDIMSVVAEGALPNVVVPETDPLDVSIDDLAAATDSQPTLARPLCEYIDLDAVNALGIVEYDTISDIGPDFCSLAQSDISSGYSQLMAYVESFTMDDLLSYYPGGTDVTVAGRPGYAHDVFLWVETDAGLITFQAALPDDAAAAGVDPSDITIPVAELVVGAIDLAE